MNFEIWKDSFSAGSPSVVRNELPARDVGIDMPQKMYAQNLMCRATITFQDDVSRRQRRTDGQARELRIERNFTPFIFFIDGESEQTAR